MESSSEAAPSPAVLYSRPYEASTSIVHNSGTPIIGIPSGVQATECPGTVAHLIVLNEENNTGCSANCLSSTNATITVTPTMQSP